MVCFLTNSTLDLISVWNRTMNAKTFVSIGLWVCIDEIKAEKMSLLILMGPYFGISRTMDPFAIFLKSGD